MTTTAVFGVKGIQGKSYSLDDVPGSDLFIAFPVGAVPKEAAKTIIQRMMKAGEVKGKRSVKGKNDVVREVPDLSALKLIALEDVGVSTKNQLMQAGAEVVSGEHDEPNFGEMSNGQIAQWIEKGSYDDEPEEDDDDLFGSVELEDGDEAEGDASEDVSEEANVALQSAPAEKPISGYRPPKIKPKRSPSMDTPVDEVEEPQTPQVQRIGDDSGFDFGHVPTPSSNKGRKKPPPLADFDDESDGPAHASEGSTRVDQTAPVREPSNEDDFDFSLPGKRQPSTPRRPSAPVREPIREEAGGFELEDDDDGFKLPPKTPVSRNPSDRRRATSQSRPPINLEEDAPHGEPSPQLPSRMRPSPGFQGIEDELEAPVPQSGARRDRNPASRREPQPEEFDGYEEDDFDPLAPIRRERRGADDSTRNTEEIMRRQGFSEREIESQISARKEREFGAKSRFSADQMYGETSAKKFYICAGAGGIGKTTLTWSCANMLAESLRESGSDKPVYLIETDFSNPKLEDRINLGEPGINLGSVAKEISRFQNALDGAEYDSAQMAKIVDRYTIRQQDSGLNVLVCPYRMSEGREYIVHAILSAIKVAESRGAYIFLDSSNATTRDMDEDSWRIAKRSSIIVIVATPANINDTKRSVSVFTKGSGRGPGSRIDSGINPRRIALFLNHATNEQLNDLEREHGVVFAGKFPFIPEIAPASETWVGDDSVPYHVKQQMYECLPPFLYALGIPEMADYSLQADSYSTRPSFLSRLLGRR